MLDFLGITSSSYQKWASECLGQFLAARPSSAEELPVKLRVSQMPPSAQIMKLPAGGFINGVKRIREKLYLKKENVSEQAPHLLLPHNETDIAIAREEDLTRECLIVTLHDASLEAIIRQDLLSSKESARAITWLRESYPNFFVAFQRYLLGIEHDDGIKVGFKVVTAEDDETLEYLKRLALSMG